MYAHSQGFELTKQGWAQLWNAGWDLPARSSGLTTPWLPGNSSQQPLAVSGCRSTRDPLDQRPCRWHQLAAPQVNAAYSGHRRRRHKASQSCHPLLWRQPPHLGNQNGARSLPGRNLDFSGSAAWACRPNKIGTGKVAPTDAGAESCCARPSHQASLPPPDRSPPWTNHLRSNSSASPRERCTRLPGQKKSRWHSCPRGWTTSDTRVHTCTSLSGARSHSCIQGLWWCEQAPGQGPKTLVGQSWHRPGVGLRNFYFKVNGRSDMSLLTEADRFTIFLQCSCISILKLLLTSTKCTQGHYYPYSHTYMCIYVSYIYMYMHREYIYIYVYYHHYCYYTSSTAQGGGGSFKNRKPIGEVGCCEWQSESTDGPKGAWGLLSVSLFLWLSTYLPAYLLCIYLSIDLSISLFLSFI